MNAISPMLFSFFLLFFLLWVFSLTTWAQFLNYVGPRRSAELLRRISRRFFYGPCHRLLFAERSFAALVVASELSAHLGRFAYVSGAMLPFLWLPIHLASAIFLGCILLLLFIGDILPRWWITRSYEEAISYLSPFVSVFLYLSLPVSFFLFKLLKLFSPIKETSLETSWEETKEEIVEILQAANFKGRLNNADKKLIESVVKFKERIVREVMVPRINLFSLPAETPIREAAKKLVGEGYSRIPVYQETIDHIVGVLMFKDILELYMDCLEGKYDSNALQAPIKSMAKSVFYTPETKKAAQLLQDFRAKQMHMAIVVDEYGGTEGIVTIEDILEEIVGEIADEYDIGEEQLFAPYPGEEGSWIVDARMSILDAEEIFDIQISQEGEYDTLGGYIFHKIGAIPPRGLRIHHEEFDLEILSSSERSVEKICISLRKPAHPNDHQGE